MSGKARQGFLKCVNHACYCHLLVKPGIFSALFPPSAVKLAMFGAAAVRKKRKEQTNNLQNPTRHPYIKPFGPRFDPSTLPYFKYKRALIEAHELKVKITGSGPGSRGIGASYITLLFSFLLLQQHDL